MHAAVSIILPTYNRSRFLPQALRSIEAQSFADWELIIVDDGSTDDTRAIIDEYRRTTTRPVRYVYQENAGPYAARNTGLDLATARFIAFFDSDDHWLPHHLTDCVGALESNADVDWVFGACCIVDFVTGRTLDPTTFYVKGQARQFLKLRARSAGQLRIIEDPNAVQCTLLHGFYCGLQNSVFRGSFFANRRFRTEFRNEAEDQLLVVRALTGGHRLAYMDNVHVIYHVHDAHSSGAGHNDSLDRRLNVCKAVARGFEELRDEVRMSEAEHRALNQRLSREYFWTLGYALLWQQGRRAEAIEMFRRGLRLHPWNFKYWKTYLLALTRSKLRATSSP
jgi:glycosyltransferase involved in cell wall biosynthesis